MGLTTSLHASVCRLVRTHLGRNGLGRALGVALGAAGLVASASAQSPLTTIFASTTQGTAGGNVFFNLTARNPITVTRVDVNTNSAVGTTGTIEVYRTAVGGTYVGNTANMAAWTLVGSGSISAAGGNQHTICDVSDFNLDVGTYGFAVRYVGVVPIYTNNGTTPQYSTEELVFETGAAQAAPFTGGINTPRIWNGSIYYVPYVQAASGACCSGNGTCSVVANASCAGVFQGAATVCSPSPCPAHRGGCCNSTSGGCTLSFTGAAGCPSGSTYLGDQTGATACGPCVPGACCNSVGGCILSASTGCTTVWGPGVTGSTFLGAGTSCVPNPCAQPPAPTNDECASAIVLSSAGSSRTVLGNNAQATPDTDLVNAVCAQSGRDVFYSFTPLVTADYTLTTCNTVTIGHDTVLSVHTGCPADGSNMIACSDDDCTGGAAGPSTIPNAAFPSVTLNAGTTYIIAVATWHPTQPTISGPFALTVSSEAVGICCAQSGACTLSVASQCVTPSIFTPDLTTCSATFCSGACCNNATAACFVGGPGSCGTDSTFAGVNTTCTTNPCPGQACCNGTTGACTVTGTGACPSGSTGQGPGSVCAPTNLCGEACCAASGACTFVGTGLCPPGTGQGAGSTCLPNLCAAPQPSNDQCGGAPVLTVNGPAISGTTYGANSDAAPACTTTILDVFYQFPAALAGQYTITVTSTNVLGPFNIGVAVYSDCPTNTEVACLGANQTTSVLTIGSAAGANYWVRVADFGGQPGPHTIRVAYSSAVACCNAATGACTSAANAGACPSGSTGQPLGSACTPNVCTQPGVPTNDDCTSAIALALNVGVQGNNGLATGDGTEGPGGACYATSPTSFNRAVWYTFTPAVTGTYLVSTCGTPFDTVLSIFSGPDCNTLTSVGCDDDTCTGTTDVPSPGPGPGDALASTINNVTLTAGTLYRIRASAWGAGAGGGFGIIVTPVGSCCVGTACSLGAQALCTGTFTASGVCSPNPCATAGVCCRGATCTTTITTSAACTASLIGGQQAGAVFSTGAACNVGAVSSSPCCYANYDKVNGIAVNDIFAFLNDWFASSPFANTGGNGTPGPLSVQNIFDFLSAWFNGGC